MRDGHAADDRCQHERGRPADTSEAALQTAHTRTETGPDIFYRPSKTCCIRHSSGHRRCQVVSTRSHDRAREYTAEAHGAVVAQSMSERRAADDGSGRSDSSGVFFEAAISSEIALVAAPAPRRIRRLAGFVQRRQRNRQGFSICLWQYSQSELIELPSFATRVPSWQRKQPADVVCPTLSG